MLCARQAQVPATEAQFVRLQPERHNIMLRLIATAAVVVACTAGEASRVTAQLLPARADTGSLILTTGSGEVSLSPDRATIRLQVETRAPSAAQASRDNNATVRRVIDSLRAAPQSADSVLVVAVSVRPNQNYQSGTLVGYTASAIIRVNLHSLDRLGAVLDRALTSGATGVDRIEFHSDHESTARLQALAQAYRNARADAEVLAEAAGVRLGSLAQLSTEPQFGPVYGLTMNYSGIEGSVPITPSDVRVTATVHAQWHVVR